VQLHIHQIESLLHVPDVIAGIIDEHPSLTHEGSQREHLGTRPECSVEQTMGVQLPNPLAVHHVSLLLVPPSDASGIDQFGRQSPCFENRRRFPLRRG
jgi:hypothetical protein